jgi:simple sugar transport system ATP-binding protein
VGATELTHTLLAAARARGAGVLLVSEDLDELLRLCDRIMVLFAGESMGTVAAEGADRGQLGLMMAGAARA